jgi:hypothetical protein
VRSIAPRPEDLREGVYLGGFGSYRQRRATGVHDEPYCRALALSDGATGVVLAVLDLVGASGPLLENIRTRAAHVTGLPQASVLLACTHSHASPDTQGLWGGTAGAYQTFLADQAVTAIAEAHQALAPAAAVAATAALGGVVRNRRGWPETDETLTAVRFTTPDGASVATLINYACHPTASGPTNTEVSRDWCGYTVDVIERELGGMAIYVNGAIGDVNPAAGGSFDAAQALGEAVANAALASLSSADEVGGAVRLRTRRVLLPMNLDGLSQRVQGAVARAAPALSVIGKTGGLRAVSVALHAAGRADLAQVVAALEGNSERKIHREDGRTFLATQCSHIAVGSAVEGIAAPGEVLTRLALPLRSAMSAPHRLFFGLTHDSLGYFVPEDEWVTGRNNNYEESVSYGKHAGSALAEALRELIPQREATQ